MPQWFTKKIEEKEQALYVTPKPPQTESVRLTGNATKDLSNIRAALHDTADFMVREITVCGIPVKLMMFEGMFSLQTLTEIMLEPLGRFDVGRAVSPGAAGLGFASRCVGHGPK